VAYLRLTAVFETLAVVGAVAVQLDGSRLVLLRNRRRSIPQVAARCCSIVACRWSGKCKAGGSEAYFPVIPELAREGLPPNIAEESQDYP
jgi:hypothetical protein